MSAIKESKYLANGFNMTEVVSHRCAEMAHALVVEMICALACLILFFGPSPVPAASKDVASHIADGDWLYVDHDLAGTRYSKLKQITAVT